MSDSQNLIETPDLSGAPNLKLLILRRCIRLYKIHASLGDLKRLILLDMDTCKRLESLPHNISWNALEIFILSGCSRLKKLPEVVTNILYLEELSLDEITITPLPVSVKHSTSLIKLDLRDCKNLSSLLNGCYSSMSLKIPNLSGCSKLDHLPENFGERKDLKQLYLCEIAVTVLPSSDVYLKNLRVLALSKNICMGLSSKSFLSRCMGLSFTSFISSCKGVFPKPLISGCTGLSLRFPLMQSRSLDPMGMGIGLCSLTKLGLSYCNIQTIPNFLGCLSYLEHLNLGGNNFVSLPESIIQLFNLTYLYLEGCTHLRMLPELPLNIKYIDARKCTSLETLPLRPESDFRPKFRRLNCDKLIKNQG